MGDDSILRNLPRYRCHKEVWALKIIGISYVRGDGQLVAGALITPEEDGYDAFEVSREYVHKHQPQVGGYFVVYDDGYQSYSPAKAFEEGYTRIE